VKQGISATTKNKKPICETARMCYFPRRFSSARCTRSVLTAKQSLEEYRSMAKKGGAPTKSEVLTHISKDTGLSRKQVGSVFDSLGGVIKKSLRGSGLFTMPGLLKMKVVKKPATKAREGVNPFTGEKMMFKAKPASKKVRVMPLKSLKAMVNS
jgi:nucleoid DNA-binding protein